MRQVSIQDLRIHCGDLIGRVEAGEHITVTRDGKEVAELRPVSRKPIGRSTLIKRWSRLPAVDVLMFRLDVDQVFNPAP
jgi:prevent-host-death family protein